MKIRALIGWGIVIYAVLYLVWTGLVIHGLSGTIVSRVIVLATLATVTAIATRSLRVSLEREIIPYAVGWIVIAAMMDAIFAVPSAGWGIYSDWNLWVGYILLFIVPLIVIAVSKKRTATIT